MFKIIASFLLLLAFAIPAAAQEEPLVFALPSTGSAQAVLEMWSPLLEDMTRDIGRPVEAKVFDDYAGVVWALQRGDVQLAWLGNKGAIEAVDRVGVEVGAQIINADGERGYYAHLITREDSPLEDVDDVMEGARELTFGNGDPNSTSGSLVPGYYVFAARGLDPAQLFKRMTRAGHEDNFLAVAEGTVDVATNNSADLYRLGKRFPEKAKAIKIIWTSPLIPSDPIIWSKDLPAPLKREIVRFLSNYGKSEGKSPEQTQHERAVLKKLNWSGFRESDNAQLIPVRKVKLYKELLQAKADAALSEEQRDNLVRGIENELRELEELQ